MGSLGPIRVATDSPRSTHNAPFDIRRQQQQPTRQVRPGVHRRHRRRILPADRRHQAGQAFWGTDPDIDAFARGIERYLTANDRWNSPKFIFGESYGTTRSAGLSYRLQQDGAQLNGVILLSSILNYGRRDPGFDQELINYMPSFAAAAAYHNRVSPRRRRTSRPFCAKCASGRGVPYALALAKGQELPDAERQSDRPPDGGLYRPVGTLHSRQRPAGLRLALPQGAAARPAADPRPLRRALHRRGCRRRRRHAGLRSLGHRNHRAPSSPPSITI